MASVTGERPHMRRTNRLLAIGLALTFAFGVLAVAPARTPYEAIPASIQQYPGQITATVYYASRIPGVKLDCDLAARAKIGGGTPTDNSTAINAVLATASSTKPIDLVIDGGCALAKPLVIPATGYVTIRGLGWGTGLYVLPGSNAQAIQNVAHTDLAIWQTWSPGGAQSIVGRNVAIRNLRIDAGRGTPSSTNTLVSGQNNSTGNAGRDGTVTDATALASTGDARGPYSAGYWLSAVMLVGIDMLHVEDVWIYDAPAYHLNLFHCTNVYVSRCRVQAGNPGFSANTDGIHLNGGTRNVWIDNCYFATGDDPVALNADEGDGSGGGPLFISQCFFDNCQGGVRVYGAGASTMQVVAKGIRGTTRFWGAVIGEPSLNPVSGALNSSITFEDWQLNTTDASFNNPMFLVCGNVGTLTLRDVHSVGQTLAGSMVQIGSSSATPAIRSLRLEGTLDRDGSGNAAMSAVKMVAGTVTTLDISFRVRDLAGSSYAAVADLIPIGGGTIGRLWVSDVEPTHVTALTNTPGSITTKAGPGLAASGF